MAEKLGTVVIGGGTGFVGTAISQLLRKKGYSIVIVSRMPGPYRMSWTDLERNGLPTDCTAVVNVAGQNVLNPARRWTPGFKQNVVASRVNTTKSLAKAIVDASMKPKVFVTMSGVGYYKPSDNIEYTEENTGGDHDFLAKLCTKWEAAATIPKESGVRQVIIRSGVVLGRHGGMIKQMFMPFFFGLGGPVGSGSQYMPWIHLEDIAGLFVFAIENDKVQGVLNGVAPQIVTNREFTKAFGRALWRPTLFPLPTTILNWAFSEERAKIMTEGQKVIPKRTLEYGYKFKYPDIESACKSVARLIYADDLAKDEAKYM